MMMQSLVLWPTSRCNLACRYCYAASVPQKDMQLDTARKAMELMGDAPYKIQLAGGEPLINPGLVADILELCAQQSNCMGVSIQTNATLLDDAAIELLKKYNVAIGVSLDGKPQTNDEQRGKTGEVAQGILRLREHGLAANLTCVVTANNVDKLDEVVDMAAYFGNIRGIGLDLLRKAGRALALVSAQEVRPAAANAVQPASAQQLAAGLENLYSRVRLVNRALPPGRQIVIREFAKAHMLLNSQASCRDYCYAAQGQSYVVLPGGDCYPCGSLAGNRRYHMGNVHTTVRSLSIQGKRPKACGTCRYNAACTGGCPSRGLLCGGFDQLDCVMKKYAFKIAEE